MQLYYYSLVILIISATATVYGSTLDAQPISDNISFSQTSLISWIWQQMAVVSRLVWKISSLPILPFIWMTRLIWRHLILTPWDILVQAINIMYPVLLFCGAACICGLIIGGCSGFAAEALSSALLNATWGKQTIDKNLSEYDIEEEQDDAATIHTLDDDTEYDSRTFDDDDQSMGCSEKGDMDSLDWRRTSSRHSPSSSLFRLSFSSTNPNTLSRPSSFYDDKPNDWQGDEDPEEIASFLRQRRRFQQQQQQQQAAY